MNAKNAARLLGYVPTVAAFLAQAVLSTLVWLLAWCVLPYIVSWHSYVVLSGSMAPAIRTGDVVIVGTLLTDHPAAGAVIAFDDPAHDNRVLMHRIIKLNDDATFVTKGDANPEADSTPVTEDDVLGQGRLRVPWVGLPAYWAQTKNWFALGASLVALGGLVVLAWERRSRGQPPPTDLPPTSGRHRKHPFDVTRRRTDKRVSATVALGVILAIVLESGGFAKFVSTSTTSGNALGTAASFPTYSASVTGDSPLFYHRQDEAQSSSATSTAADSSGNSRPGQYNAPTNGPYTYWRFDDASGIAASDSSGGANSGTLINGPTWSTGLTGSAVTFDGVNDRVVSTGPSANTDTSFSVSVWVRTSTASSTAVALSQAGNTHNAWYIYTQSGKWRFGLPRSDVANPTEDYVISSTSVASNTWTHIVGVYDDPNNAFRIYVNGSLEASGPRSDSYEWRAGGVMAAGGVLINGSWLYPWAGSIDDVRVYSRVLGASEISGIMGAATAPNAQYAFEQSGSVLTDSGPNGYNGTISGATWNTNGHTTRSLTFDGVDDYVTASHFSLRTDTSFTASAWMYISSSGGVDRTILSKDSVNNSSFSLTYVASTGKFAFIMPTSDTVGSATVSATTSNPAVANAWMNVLGVWDAAAGQMRIYLNGTLESTVSRTGGWNGLGSISIGRGQRSGSYVDYWPGRIDDVALYNRVLSSSDVEDAYTRPTLDWQFNDNIATTVSDSSGNGNTGALNAVQWTDSGYEGTAGIYNGSSSWTVSQSPAIRTDFTFTASAWVYMTTPSQDRAVVSQQGTIGSAFMLGADIASVKWVFRMPRTDGNSPTYDTVYSTADATQNRWYHLVGVFFAGSQLMRFYVDGVLQGSVSHPGAWNATNPLQVGRALRSGSQMDYFDGIIDKVRTIQAGLSTAQVQNLYNAGAPAPAALPVAGALSPMNAAQPGALQGAQQGQSSSTATGFNGTTNATNLTSFANPTNFTIEAWFKVSGNWGGLIGGFFDTVSVSSTARDRVVYLDSAGRVTFAVNPAGGIKSVNSVASYNDGTWHHMAASLGSAGMKLYVDGVLVAQDAATTTAQNYTGYWRWGGGILTNYPNRPISDYLVGALDEYAVYGSQLSDAQIRRHYHANH
ncbi:signal peptidase I [Actinokineospora diospyrosa]|uniref:Signal peptidase I n=1 Tax=Actinokineospora diospyrosa TaxID=103728 RepID=A0ABT1I610_9PSEU|nr:signal peptidase I [Actinokineospora diospyrosa]